MYGWIHESIKQLVCRKYGVDVWRKILGIAKFEEGTESRINHNYTDEETYRLVSSVATVLGVPNEEIWEAYGDFLITHTMLNGWDDILRCLGSDLHGFLNGIDRLHYFCCHEVFKTTLEGPSFRCEVNPDESVTLHYYSKRTGCYPIVKGCVRRVARQLYGVDVSVKIIERRQEIIDERNMTEHVVFHVEEMAKPGEPSARSLAKSQISLRSDIYDANLLVSLMDFAALFPYHICFDGDLKMSQIGINIHKVYPSVVLGESRLDEILEIIYPEMPISFHNFMTLINGVFTFKMKELQGLDGFKANKAVYLKGQMALLECATKMVYLCSPNVTTVQELMERQLHLTDIPIHDATRDLILLNQTRMSQVQMTKNLEEKKQELKAMAEDLEHEKDKTDNLLRELLPASVVDQLRHGKTVDACEFPEATILFTDIVTFTTICSGCTPYDVVSLLNELYLRFDRLTGLHYLYKVETIGDAYMVVGGVPEKSEDHAVRVCNMALGMIWEAKSVFVPNKDRPVQIRAGIHSGPVVAGVVGKKMPRFCLFGDIVNIASSMESHSVPSKIHVSKSVYDAASSRSALVFEERGWTEIKNKGTMFTYFLLKNNRKSLWEIVNRERTEDSSIDGYSELHDISCYKTEEEKEKAININNNNNNQVVAANQKRGSMDFRTAASLVWKMKKRPIRESLVCSIM